MVILGLDYGDRYVGVALTDPDGEFTYRFGTIDQKRDDVLEEVQILIEEESVKKIVVGMPQGLRANETEQKQKTRAFVERLREEFGDTIELAEQTEIFSSAEARRIIEEEGGRKEEEHAEAARLVLESYIKKEIIKK